MGLSRHCIIFHPSGNNVLSLYYSKHCHRRNLKSLFTSLKISTIHYDFFSVSTYSSSPSTRPTSTTTFNTTTPPRPPPCQTPPPLPLMIHQQKNSTSHPPPLASHPPTRLPYCLPSWAEKKTPYSLPSPHFLCVRRRDISHFLLLCLEPFKQLSTDAMVLPRFNRSLPFNWPPCSNAPLPFNWSLRSKGQRA